MKYKLVMLLLCQTLSIESACKSKIPLSFLTKMVNKDLFVLEFCDLQNAFAMKLNDSKSANLFFSLEQNRGKNFFLTIDSIIDAFRDVELNQFEKAQAIMILTNQPALRMRLAKELGVTFPGLDLDENYKYPWRGVSIQKEKSKEGEALSEKDDSVIEDVVEIDL